MGFVIFGRLLRYKEANISFHPIQRPRIALQLVVWAKLSHPVLLRAAKAHLSHCLCRMRPDHVSIRGTRAFLPIITQSVSLCDQSKNFHIFDYIY